MSADPGKSAFVTVGTTKFDLLIRTITQIDVLQSLREKGYKNITIQRGGGNEIPDIENGKQVGINISHYTYKNSIREDILKADLVISHAGAGTCLEVLGEKKPLLVVVNEELMHNHQTELAQQLSLDKYLFACTCATLKESIKNMDFSQMIEMEPPQAGLFVNYLNEFMGFKISD